MTNAKKWQIRILVLLQLACFLAMFWDSLRNSIVFPNGTTQVDVLTYLFLFIIMEEIVRIKAHMGAE
jgi:hypothetical protein